jgi:hypothetical protein
MLSPALMGLVAAVVGLGVMLAVGPRAAVRQHV